MQLEDFPMDAHACPLKFGSCKSMRFYVECGKIPLATHKVTLVHVSLALQKDFKIADSKKS